MNIDYRIKEDSKSKNTITIHPDTARTFNITSKKKIKLNFGKSSHQVDISVSKNLSTNRVKISKNVIHSLNLEKSLSYELRRNKNNLLIGPYIGILVRPNKVESKNYINSYIKHYKKIGGAILACSTKQIDKKKNKIDGYMYIPKLDKWKKGTYSLPKSFLIKAPLPKKWESYFDKKYPQSNFNSSSFDKWQMYLWLKNNPYLKRFLPLTTLYKKPKDVITFMEEHNLSNAYIKPLWGLKGKGIMKLEKEGNGYSISTRENDKNETLKFKSYDDLHKYLDKKLQKKSYLIQQRLDLEIWEGHLSDFRIILVKDASGEWKVIGMVGRKGPLGGIVGNRSSGGEILEGEVLLKDAYGLKNEQVKYYRDKMYEVAIKAAKEIDGIKNMNMGRYGIDIAIDKEMQMWILEINNRSPNDYLPTYIGRDDLFYKIRLENMLYAKKLAGFSSENKKKSKKEEKPSIGIFMGNRNGYQSTFAKELCKRSKDYNCTIFSFGSKDVKESNQISGYTFVNGKWRKKTFNQVDVIIDRHPGYNKKLNKVRQNPHFHFANYKTGGKWEVYQAIRKKDRLKKYLPETVIYNENNLFKMLQNHKHIYIKPLNGSLGKGIIKIEERDKEYTVTKYEQKQIKTYKRSEFINLKKLLRKWIKENSYLIQQGLDINFEDRVTDMRLLIQKNWQGAWYVTGEGMRKGKKNFPVSNLDGGGSVEKSDVMLDKVFGKRKGRKILEECYNVSHILAEEMEKEFGRLLELGIDIGVDKNNKVWIIEANTMPNRETLLKAGNIKSYHLSYQLPIEYCLYLINQVLPLQKK